MTERSLPIGLSETIDGINSPSGSFTFPANVKYKEEKTFNALSINTGSKVQPYAYTPLAATSIRLTASYSPFSYIPSSLLIFIARMFHPAPIVMLYAGRLGNLLAWIILIALSIRLMPRKKWAVVAIGLLPMGLFQAATLNADVMATGMAVIFTALILYLREQNTRLGYKQLSILLAAGAIMTLSKQAMFVFLPLVLLLRKRNFKDKRQNYLIKLCLIAIPVILLGLWMFMNRGSNLISNQHDTAGQLHFIIRSPESYINVLWNTYFYAWGDQVTRSFIGVFGWSDVPLSELIVTFGYIGLAAILIIEPGSQRAKDWFTNKEKLLIGLIAAAYMLAVSTALYLTYTPLGFKIVYGLQGRYFIPLLALAIPLLYGTWLRCSEAAYKRIAVITPIVLLSASTITIYVRFFVHNV